MRPVLLAGWLLLSAGAAQSAPPPRKPAHRASRSRPVGIAPVRALEIQTALVRAGYLDHASGHWDAATVAAMTRYQKDHHWQTRDVPDARALIALGLGPAQDAVEQTILASAPASPQ